ncbi:hypothetical protein IQ265_11785 [Nodosilinea sp. LEGE 06152]|uniref:hypothetical protein n=1 Tax=Nodosilinea sp. LEGE 06152 TaxID=2777966 RepID=UPI001880FAA1|nr:hypothetical protein [Nodosilinea sp. LEGE 06152]MBE9157498.1 hypothetical protein [Nodosilinea sp. LEGE 06152]
MKLTLGWALLGSLPLSLLSSLGSAAFANTMELSVLPLLNAPAANCPERIVAHETMQPYFEGGFATNGMIKLRDIATHIQLSQSDRFSTTWVGTLRPEYRNCQASGAMLSIDNEDFEGHSYLRVQLANGQVKAILDMTGMRDANGLTTAITFKGLRDGNPRWTWGGTD